MVLPEDQRERLRAEESYRRAIREDLEPPQRTDQGGGLLATAKQAAEVAKSLALTGALVVVVLVAWQDLLPAVRASLADGRVEQVEVMGLFSFRVSEQLQQTVGTTGRFSMSVSEVAGYESILEKGSMELLEEVRRRLSEQGAATIDNLKVVQGHDYVAQVLNAYIATLGIKFVIFDAGGDLDGWVPASTFAAQLQPDTYSYDRLRTEILGIRTERVPADATLGEVLEVMAEKHLDNIAVVDADGAFKFMANRGDLLTELIGSALLPDEQPSS